MFGHLAYAGVLCCCVSHGDAASCLPQARCGTAEQGAQINVIYPGLFCPVHIGMTQLQISSMLNYFLALTYSRYYF